ncbi:IMP-specific 5-nucleotidase [Terfezia boudieri ATCC MYA-4762]|uniref:IMP-specific 5'-nucleotidase 1 n=1 Tax=Terfezia boudieri ATCC MYA-4762 TaxID=1051890 RepID=A0A3N4LKQ7_9PEZI|nr:IMP-specific 5-nucleotidase [Terfezia boudieri ATCC MYA-4762]
MTTRYRVEYALKAHRRDALIEFIKGLLAVPFVIHSQPTATADDISLPEMAAHAHRRYTEIMKDVEVLINDHIQCQKQGKIERSKLRFLVPSVGTFFTPLALVDAFVAQDKRRAISSRRFVAPSFNDIRLILNTAQIMSLSRDGPLKLVTFDGDVTLYDDGQSLTPSNPVINQILSLLLRNVCVGIVTAAGYTDGARYQERLYGLLDAIADPRNGLTRNQQMNLIVLGGESSYLYKSSPGSEYGLEKIPRSEWQLPEMQEWEEKDIQLLLDIAETSLRESVDTMRLKALVVRKERAVGIVPADGHKFEREQLEEAVLVAQKTLDLSDVGREIPFCAFNGGNDVFVDIGDKRLGVLCCRRFFGGVEGGETLHIGDQFLSAGHNDFKARLAATCVWVSNPAETVKCLEELTDLLDPQVQN